MKEFLEHLYHLTISDHPSDGMHELFDVIPQLASEKKFSIINQIMIDLDLTRVNTTIMYGMIHLVSTYAKELPNYQSFYQSIREEFARRGEPATRIKDLFDRYEDGDPNPVRADYKPYKSTEQQLDEKLDAKIQWANEIGDQDLIDLLTYYKAHRVGYAEREREYIELRRSLGDDVLKEKTVKALRDMADKLDSTGCWPGIYYCQLPAEGPEKHRMDSIKVIYSYPWPG